MMSVDWHDFVVVETIEFYDDELDELPGPMTVKDVRAGGVARAGLRWCATEWRLRAGLRWHTTEPNRDCAQPAQLSLHLNNASAPPPSHLPSAVHPCSRHAGHAAVQGSPV